MKLFEQITELKQQGLTAEEIAEQLNKPLFFVRALYGLIQ